MLPFGVFLWSWPRAGATLGCSEWVRGFLIAVHALLIPVASLLVWQRLWVLGLRAVIHRLGCGVACDVFPNQGSNPHLLRWEHRGSSLASWITSSFAPVPGFIAVCPCPVGADRQLVGPGPPALGRAVCLTQSPGSNVNLIPQGPTVGHGELRSIPCNNLLVGKNLKEHRCVTEPLCCALEANTTL